MKNSFMQPKRAWQETYDNNVGEY